MGTQGKTSTQSEHTRKGTRTQTWKFKHLYEEERCMVSRNLPHHTTAKHTRKDKTHTWKFECLYEEKRCMVSRNLPRHKPTERTRKTRITHTEVRAPLWGGELHGFLKHSSSQDGQTHKENTKHIHESLNTFMRRRGAWFPETFPVTRRPNTQGRHETHTWMYEFL